MRKFIIFLLAVFFCLASINAQNVTITKPQKKTTSPSTGSTSSSKSYSSKKSTSTSSQKKAQSSSSSQKSITSSSSSVNSNSSSGRQPISDSSPTYKGSNAKISNFTGEINGHEYVDLGLSVRWATCNIGASSPSDYGDYFAWGETSTKSSYTEENSKTFKKDIENIAGNSSYDAARANWGSTWRLPSEEEIDELISKCKHEWTTQGGHKGYKVIGPNGNSIFLPAAGFRLNTSLNYTGEYGFYWHSPPRERDTFYAFYLFLDSGNFDMYWNYISDNGQSVRPVSE